MRGQGSKRRATGHLPGRRAQEGEWPLSDRKFVAALLAAAIGFAPLILFSWIWLVATVDFGDVLSVLCVLVVQYEIGKLRKEERATYRAIRRAEARRIDAEPWPTPSRFGDSQ